jgi:hypothetical protein
MNMILKWIVRKWVGADWIHVAEDKDQWQFIVNMVMNLWVSENALNIFNG